MAVPLTTLLQNLNERIVRMGELNRNLMARIEVLEHEKEDLQQELEEKKRELDIARTDAEFLTMSHRLASSPDSIISTRRHIARLIRTIDNCISMLKEE